MSYFNTTSIRGKQLVDYEIQASKQDSKVMEVFFMNQSVELTPEDILNNHPDFWRTPITSIRRAFTNLATAGYIVKTDNQVDGMYGRPIHTWRYNDEQ